jgi:hypothetical protein
VIFHCYVSLPEDNQRHSPSFVLIPKGSSIMANQKDILQKNLNWFGEKSSERLIQLIPNSYIYP